MRLAVLCLALALALVRPAQAQGEHLAPPVIEVAFPGVTFQRPVALRAVPGDAEWLAVVEQGGRVVAFSASGTRARPRTVVLDLMGVVAGPEVHIESGMLSAAFHPAFQTNGFLFVYYVTTTAEGPAVYLSRFTVDPGTLVADPASEHVLLAIPKQSYVHNGGDLHFGPDGFLYVSVGDGACCGDPLGNAQNPGTLEGALLRIDVDQPAGGLPYGIPPDNPFASGVGGARPEIFAYGLRNPWRFSIDPPTGWILLGDVGETGWEEVNLITAGANYGWPIMEGYACWSWARECDTAGLTLPLWAYGRDQGMSVTGGLIYRGTRVPGLTGRYVVADWMSTRMWALSLNPDGSLAGVEPLGPGPFPLVSAFGTDLAGELYLLDYWNGLVYRFTAATGTPGYGAPAAAPRLELLGPNPFIRSVRLRAHSSGGAEVRVEVLDMLGRTVSVLADGLAPASGVQDLTFDPGPLASGTYVARLWVGGRPVGAVRLTHLGR